MIKVDVMSGKYGLFLAVFLFCVNENSAMSYVMSRSAASNDRFSKLKKESGLDKGFASIKALIDKTSVSDAELKDMFYDAANNVKNICDYVTAKEEEGTEPARALAQLYKQKRMCVEYFWELYKKVKEQFAAIQPDDAKIATIKSVLLNLGIE